jgi:hypothetical protein
LPELFLQMSVLGRTALHEACDAPRSPCECDTCTDADQQRASVVGTLIQSAAGVGTRTLLIEARDSCGRTAFHCSAKYGDMSTMLLMLNAVGDPSRLALLQDNCGRMALHVAVSEAARTLVSTLCCACCRE